MDPAGALSPPPPPPGPPPYPPPQPPKRQSILTRVGAGLLSSILLVSIVANVYFGIWFYSSLRTRGPQEAVYQDGDKDQRIVILPATGLVNQGLERFIRLSLRTLEKDPPKAIVLRVDSPGGDPFASDRIVHWIESFQSKHPQVPIVASFGTVAASGGYYIAAGADQIVAEPLTRTGSIGVMSLSFTFKDLMDKIGVSPVVQTATESPMKDVANNPFRAFDQQDRQEIQESIDQLHERFVQVVHKGRADHLSDQRVRELANGKVYMTEEALEAKLVDAVGFLDDAIEDARARAGIASDVEPLVTAMQMPTRLSLQSLFSQSASPPDRLQIDQVRQWILELQTPQLEYRYYPQW